MKKTTMATMSWESPPCRLEHPLQPAQPPAHHGQHRHHVEHRPTHHHRERERRFRRADDDDHHREDAPRGDVVHRRGGDRDAAEPRLQHPVLGEHTGEHREGRHAHGCAEEEGEAGEGHAVVGQARVEEQREAGPQEEREDDAGVAGDHRRAGLAAQELQVELQAHQEHEEDQPDLAQRAQKAEAHGREDGVEQVGGRPAEERGAEHDAGEHLSHDARLPDQGDRAANQAGRDQNARDLREQQQDVGHQTRRRP